MSETLKFGNGQWATKVGSTLAYNDENGNFKSLPFNFTRSTSGTRVNKDGLIEMVTNNKPRIHFLNDSNGALLLEPTRSNIITYSEDFSNAYWNKFDSSVTSGFASPDGSTNAFKLIEGNTNTQHGLLRSNFPTNVQRTFSVFAKKGENDRVFISDYNKFNRTIGVIFNLSNGTVESNQDNTIYINPKIETFSNGWYRCSVTWTNTTGLTVPFFGNAISGTNSYQGDGVSGIYVFGAQFEEASYSTSYIPTQGAISTKVADACINENLNVDYSGDYTLYLEHETLSLTEYNQFQFRQETSISYIFRVGSSLNIGAGLYTAANTIGFNKFALSVTSIGSYKFYKNGVLLSSGSGLNANLETIKSDALGMNIKEIKLYNTALTDQELINLTTI